MTRRSSYQHRRRMERMANIEQVDATDLAGLAEHYRRITGADHVSLSGSTLSPEFMERLRDACE